MTSRHADLDLLLAAYRGKVPWREIVRWRRRHLLDLCPGCAMPSEVFAAYLRDRAGADPACRAWGYAAAAAGLVSLEEAFQGDLPAVRRELRILRRTAPERREWRVRRGLTRYRSPLLAVALIEEARGRLRRKPAEALGWLAAAGAVVNRAASDVISRDHLAPLRDIKLRIRAHEANALRVAGDLPAAEAAFSALHRTLERGEPPAIAVTAELASLEASLRLDQRRLPEAEALLERAAAFYRREGDEKGLAKVVMQRGMVLRIAGDAQRALPCFETAIEATDPDADPELAISPRHSLVLCLCDLGRPEDARALLDRYRPLYQRLDLPLAPLWLAWAEGKVAAGLGEDEAALEHLRTARDGYTERGLEFDAALVCLDLAEVHLCRAETAEVKRLAERMATAFADRGVDREAARAVALFHRTALAEAITLELIARTRTALLRAPRVGGA